MKRMLCTLTALVLALSMVTAYAENETVQVILSAGATQAFTEEAVPDTDVEIIVQAGLQAASAINQQPWYFVVIENSGGGMTGEMPADALSSMPAAAGMAKAALGDSPVAVIIYMNEGTSSPNDGFDCGLACQNMVIAASALGYSTKIISSPAMSLNGENHDALCEKQGVDPAYQAVAVLLIGHAEQQADTAASASVRSIVEEKVSFVK